MHQYGLARKDSIVLINSSEFKIGYSITTFPGQSGCPVVTGDKIIAVHIGGDKAKFNAGRIIDHAVIQRIRIWGKELST